MLIVYVHLEDEDRVIIVTIQDARSSHAVRSGEWCRVDVESGRWICLHRRI